MLFHRKKLFILFGIGLMWGLVETFGSPCIRGACGREFGGAILAGTSFLFISSSYFFCKKTADILMVLVVAVLLKLLSSPLFGIPLFHPSIINPAYAFFSQFFLFYLFISIVNKMHLSDFYKGALAGTLASIFSVFIFPFLQMAIGGSACLKSGTSIPLAYYYLPITLGCALTSASFGALLGSQVRKIIYKNNGNQFKWSLLFSTTKK